MIKFTGYIYLIDPPEDTIVTYKVSGDSPEHAIEVLLGKHDTLREFRAAEIGDGVELKKVDLTSIFFILDKPKPKDNVVGLIAPRRVSKAEFDFWRDTVRDNPLRKHGIDAVHDKIVQEQQKIGVCYGTGIGRNGRLDKGNSCYYS